MSDRWKYLPLGDACSTSAGGTPLKADPQNYMDGKIPWLLSGEVGKRNITSSTKFITPKGLANSSAKLFPASSVLVAMYGATAGEVGILRFEASTNQAVCAVLPNERYSPEFIYYFLLSQKKRLIASATGNAQPNISQAKIRSLSFPVIPLSEQLRLVRTLDETFEALDSTVLRTKQHIDNLKAVFASQLDIEFSSHDPDWKDSTLGSLCEIARGGSPRPIQDFLTEDAEGVNWVKISDATASNKYIFKTAQRIRQAGASRSRRVYSGDFLLSNSMSFGRPYIMKTEGCVHDGWLVLSKYEKHLDADFLYLTLGAPYLFQQFDKLAGGSTVRNLNSDLASKVVLRFPDIAKQRAIADRLSQLQSRLEEQEEVQKHKILLLNELKDSLLFRAFSGNL